MLTGFFKISQSLMRIFFVAFLCSISLLLFAQDDEQKSAVISVKTFDDNIEPINVAIDVLDNETKEVVTKLESSGAGNASFPLEVSKTYVIIFSKPGYLFQSVVLNLSDSVAGKKNLKDILLSKVEPEKKTILNNVAFDVYQKIMLEESLPDIDRVVQLLNENPKLQVEFGGHTDNFGTVNLNQKLSEERVKTLVDLLVSKGIDEMRLKYKGYGPSQPVASNFTEEGRTRNNRVEMKIVKLDYVPLSASELKKKKANSKKAEENKTEEQETNTGTETDTVRTSPTAIIDTPPEPISDSLMKIDYKGMFIADKKPMANSIVNLLTDQGQVYQSTKTDANGGFEFVGVPAEKELTLGLDPKESKKFKSVQLADTAGVVVEDLEKVNGEFVHRILPSEKIKLGKVYVEDPVLKIKRPKSKNSSATGSVIGRAVSDNGMTIKVDIEVVDISTGTVVQKTTSKGSGDFTIELPAGKTYDITVSKFGYSFQTVNVILPDVSGYERKVGDVSLQKVEAGKKIVLNNIFFDVNQSSLRKESYSELGRALKLMNDISSMNIEISGHTDNVGSSKSNKALSEDRAKAVMNYLVENGASKDRITYKGYGSTQPVANNATEAGRQMNRRTEFKVLQVDAAELKAKEESNAAENQGVEEGFADSDPKQMPQAFRKYDLDKNGTISYEEVIGAIDTYFEEHPEGNTQKKNELNSLFDYYFEK